MKDQINVAEIRQLYDIVKPIVPLMNHTEMTAMAVLCNQVLERYKREEYPDEDWGDSD